jgi:hypothetical protein
MVPRRAIAAALRNVSATHPGVPDHFIEEYTQAVEILASLVGRLAHTLLEVVPGVDQNRVRPFTTNNEVRHAIAIIELQFIQSFFSEL